MNIIEIGIGPHAKRVYLPALKKYMQSMGIHLSLVVELKEEESSTREYFKTLDLQPDFLFVDAFTSRTLPEELERYLSAYVVNNAVNGVIISTEPLSHFAYASWALKMELNVLIDKPLSTYEFVSEIFERAEQVEQDYHELMESYMRLQKKKKTIFSINAQRRYHPGFNFIKSQILEIAEKTHCPVTAIQSTHCDGQWRLPSEIVTQKYHPYSIYGKISHSGYHFFDVVFDLYRQSFVTGKVADEMELFSSLVKPRGLLKQLTEADYEELFGDSYKDVKQYSDEQLQEMYKGYGEVDASMILRMLNKGDNVANLVINLMHNGYSRRTWIEPGSDLYKGNGRVKHEYHNIEQGPFQNIQVHSYQSEDKHEANNASDYDLGGNNHFDILVFRNKDITGDAAPMRKLSLRDLKEHFVVEDDSKLAIELIKYGVVLEFLQFITGELGQDKLISNLDDHLMPVRIMSAAFKSHCLYKAGKNPLVRTGVEYQ